MAPAIITGAQQAPVNPVTDSLHRAGQLQHTGQLPAHHLPHTLSHKQLLLALQCLTNRLDVVFIEVCVYNLTTKRLHCGIEIS